MALGTVPLNDGTEAAKELERAMTTLGMKGAEILTNVAGRELSDPEFSPFWKKAEELVRSSSSIRMDSPKGGG